MSDERRDAWRQVRVTFRKAVSDGNYGTESAEVTLEDWVSVADCAIEETYNAFVEDLLQAARAIVHGELERSPSQRVRSAIDHSVHSKQAAAVLIETYADEDD